MFWKVRAMPRSAIRCEGSAVSSASPYRTTPVVALYAPPSTLMQVDLPAPLGPISAWMVPGSTVKETSDSAVMPPNRTVSASTSSRWADAVSRRGARWTVVVSSAWCAPSAAASLTPR
jgi:hypothetical protein